MIKVFLCWLMFYIYGMITVIVWQDNWEYFYKKFLYILCYGICIYFLILWL